MVEVFMSAILLIFRREREVRGRKNWTRDYTEKGPRVAAATGIAHNRPIVAGKTFQ
jgi:hypothetical protein